MSNHKPVSIIDEHPLPMTEEEAKEMQTHNPTFGELDREQMHPDEFREYQQMLAKNHTWHVFALHIYGHESFTYVWNHQLGYGLRFEEDHEFESLADALDGVAADLGVTA